jgi:hypothetical protein
MAKQSQDVWPPRLPKGTAITTDPNGVNFAAGAGANTCPYSSWDQRTQSAAYATGPGKMAAK